MRLPALALALLVSASSALTVWSPERQARLQLTGAGLKTAGGQAVLLPGYEPSRWGALAEGSFQFRLPPRPSPQARDRLEVLTSGGQVYASLQSKATETFGKLFSTVRGPCVSISQRTNDRQITTRCLTPDLRTEWARLDGEPLLITRGGGAAYLSPWPDPGTPYSPLVPVTRVDLRTGERTALTLDAHAAEPRPEDRRAEAETYDARNVTYNWLELPRGRFLACVALTLPKTGCRYEVLDFDARHLLTLEGTDQGGLIPPPSLARDGRTLYTLGNHLHVWDADTGKRTLLLRDPLWQKQNLAPVAASLTPDSQQAAVLVQGFKNGGLDPRQTTAFVYALPSGQRVTSFPVTAR